MPAPRSRRSAPTIADDTLEAFRHLCELVHRPTVRHLDAAASVDWSDFPRVAAVFGDDATPRTPARIGIDVRALLEQAHAELADAHPSTDAIVSGLDVVRMHLIDGDSWDSITTARLEAGHPVSARTLRTRQREGLHAILEWAARVDDETAEAEVPADAAEPTPPESPPEPPSESPPGARRLRPATGVIAALVLLAAVVFGRDVLFSGSPADDLAPHHVGRLIAVTAGAHVLPAPLPPVPLPYPDAQIGWAMVVVREGAFALALSVLPSRSEPAFFALWDPARGEEHWRYELETTPDEVMTHATLPADAAEQSFWPDKPYFGMWEAHLDGQIVVTHIQPYSPCIVTALDLLDGTERGRYVHPGRLETGFVADLDGDGRAEVVLAGTDNAVVRPALVVLDANALQGAASTVMWKLGDAIEDGLGRVLLPDLPDFREAVGTERLEVLELDPLAWDPVRGVLTLEIGTSTGKNSMARAYQVQLGRDLRTVPGAGLVFGESELRSWRRAGLDPPDPATILGSVEVLGSWPARSGNVTAKKSFTP